VSVIPDRIFFRMGDVSRILGLKPYVIRFWETEFSFVAPVKGASGQRVYQRAQIEALFLVKHLLYVERYSIEGAKKRISELRKTGKLKSAIEQVVSAGAEPESAPLAVGDKIDKSKISALLVLKEQLHGQLRELQEMIREPKRAGLDVPGLKELGSSRLD
jgi:DNA-binding transcriptional MerR regulator